MNGCHSRKPYVPLVRVQDGRDMDGLPVMRWLRNTGTQNCQYTLSEIGAKDKGCEACTWKKRPDGNQKLQ